MKKFRIFNLHIDWFFSLHRVKTLKFDLPVWADGVSVTNFDTPDSTFKVKYYKGCEKFFIDLPKCKKADEVFLTPRIYRENGERKYSESRHIIVDVFN